MKARPHMNTRIKKAIDQEVNRQIGENVDKLSHNITALVLWRIHTHFGCGKKRLLGFYKDFLPDIRALQEYYEMYDSDSGEFLCATKLKDECGIDVYELDKMIPVGIALSDNKQRS